MLPGQKTMLPAGLRRTRIIATLGPASQTPDQIRNLILAGTDIFRLNLSHGTVAQHEETVRLVRSISREERIQIGVLVDVPGPKLRIRAIRGGIVLLRDGQAITLGGSGQAEADIIIGPDTCIPATVPGDQVLIADGAATLRITRADTVIHAVVTGGGTIRIGAGVVIPGRRPDIPYTGPELVQYIGIARSLQPDFIALSFVGSGRDVADVREILQEPAIPLIAKIETRQAVDRLDEILNEADAIMVARGDLGVELPIEEVPQVQKQIIRTCNQAGKPVITATEMLESMITHSRPTRAEVTDVANAITDGTDATMLSAETSVGSNPAASVAMMARVAIETERHLPYKAMLEERRGWHEMNTEGYISYSAASIADGMACRAIVAYTRSGLTAERVSRCRPYTPILAITADERVARHLLLSWGIFPCLQEPVRSADDLFAAAIRLGKATGLASPGDQLVIIAGNFEGQQGRTNTLKVEEIPS